MTTTMLTADDSAFKALFPNKPFRIQHKLAGDPRLTLPAILELVKALPRDRIEYNSGKANVSQDPSSTPLVDLDPEDVVSQIETAGAWMVLKRVEHHPVYKALLEEALASVAIAQGYKSARDARFTDIQGFMFVSSPNSTTPFHLDSEDNFFVQVHGDKQFSIYDNEDRKIASEDTIEYAITKHRNIKYDDKFEPKAMHNKLKPGEGVFVPYLWPHWVKTFDSYSISVAITWKTKTVKRRNDPQGVMSAAVAGLSVREAQAIAVWLQRQDAARPPDNDAASVSAARAAAERWAAFRGGRRPDR